MDQFQQSHLRNDMPSTRLLGISEETNMSWYHKHTPFATQNEKEKKERENGV